MPGEADNQKIDRQNERSRPGVTAEVAHAGPPGSAASQAAAATPQGNPSALVVSQGRLGETEVDEEPSGTKLDHLPMQLDVMVKVQSFRVQDLLALEKGSVVETVHEHTQDVPVRSGGALLAWAEFEVLDQQLAVRVTRLG